MQDPSGKRLSLPALAELLPAADGKSATEWLDAIIEKVTAYAGGVAFADDIAAVAAVYRR
jgi:hypothetical protein